MTTKRRHCRELPNALPTVSRVWAQSTTKIDQHWKKESQCPMDPIMAWETEGRRRVRNLGYSTTYVSTEIETSVESILAVRSNRNKQISNPHNESCKSSFDSTFVSFDSTYSPTCRFETTHCECRNPFFSTLLTSLFQNHMANFRNDMTRYRFSFNLLVKLLLWVGKKMKSTYLKTTVFSRAVCPVWVFAPAKKSDGTVGFKKKKDIVALVQKKTYVDRYWTRRRFGEEPSPTTFDQKNFRFVSFFLRERHTMMARGYGLNHRLWCCHPRWERCRFITTPWATLPTFGFVGIDGEGE